MLTAGLLCLTVLAIGCVLWMSSDRHGRIDSLPAERIVNENQAVLRAISLSCGRGVYFSFVQVVCGLSEENEYVVNLVPTESATDPRRLFERTDAYVLHIVFGKAQTTVKRLGVPPERLDDQDMCRAAYAACNHVFQHAHIDGGMQLQIMRDEQGYTVAFDNLAPTRWAHTRVRLSSDFRVVASVNFQTIDWRHLEYG